MLWLCSPVASFILGVALSVDGDIAPHLAEITDKILFGDVWQHPALSPRDHSLLTISRLIALYRTNELPFYLGKGLDNA